MRGEMRRRVDTADWLVVGGAAAIGAGMWFLFGWPGVLLMVGMAMVLIGVGEARRKR